MRPVANAGWSELARLGKGDFSVDFVGDSIGEQHFVALLCHAWSEGIPMDGPHRRTNGTSTNSPFTWQATVRPPNSKSRILLQLHRTSGGKPDMPMLATNYRKPDVLIVNGINNHGATEHIPSYINSVASIRRGKATLLVEALPTHFPGGKYLKPSRTIAYPPAASAIPGAACNDKSTNSTDTKLSNAKTLVKPQQTNAALHDIARPSFPWIQVLEVWDLYTARGQAHVGHMGDERRDCLHFCHAPGVHGALTLATLVALAEFRGHIELRRKHLQQKELKKLLVLVG